MIKPTTVELRAIDPDNQWWQEKIDREVESDAHAPKVLPPCPSWCRYMEFYSGGLFPNHEYDTALEEGEGWVYSRFHVSGREDIYVAQEEFNRDGVVELGPLHLSGVGDSPALEETTAAEARQMAADLLNAADNLDEIEAKS